MRFSKVSLIATSIFVVVVYAISGCSPKGKIEVIESRSVPYPLATSGASIANDSLVAINWLTRALIPDPLAGGDEGPKMIVEAVLYGNDLIDAEIARKCGMDTARVTPCYEDERDAYTAKHRPDSLVRIQLRLRSEFSINSLDTKFWDIYLRCPEGIMLEPITIVMDEPVVVQRDSIGAPGRPPIRTGLYTRAIDLYFPITTRFGTTVVGPETDQIVLVMSKRRRDLAVFTWRIDGDDTVVRRDARRREAKRYDINF